MDNKPLENEDPEMFGRMSDRYYTEEDFKNCNLKIDAREVFDLIRDIKDPEHPMTLEELGVVDLDMVQVDDIMDFCYIRFRPTIPHCSMATLIGLAIKVQLLRILPARFKVDVFIETGTHVSCTAINKQLADKERIAAALENVHLHEVINDCILFTRPQTLPKFLQDALKEANKLNDPKVKYILHSRHHVECYRRWNDMVYGDQKKWKSSLAYKVEDRP